MGQVQVISGVERRRRWNDDQKRAIVAAAFAPGAVVAEVARRADINSGQIYRWRRDLQMSPPGFAEVVVSSVVGPSDISASMIDVALSDGTHVQIPATTPPELSNVAAARAAYYGAVASLLTNAGDSIETAYQAAVSAQQSVVDARQASAQIPDLIAKLTTATSAATSLLNAAKGAI
ncbi:hypothetical protein CCR94_02245 [Rhodoblastus sphagnicola]|uniref:Transposase n=1 Tax=Rhodoblastus sphagnicola TaxID=333368 RepID=A0A2S6NF23_9HYPH|nr:transposase [Rhodoblastus sphagnicola]MBB4200205.1 hypothetical protein [Rhodoblastus sphagnicola]PPQ33242.1 hypothetical protein CCR94_02245 [Rhodoblastus sphagnicola]